MFFCVGVSRDHPLTSIILGCTMGTAIPIVRAKLSSRFNGRPVDALRARNNRTMVTPTYEIAFGPFHLLNGTPDLSQAETEAQREYGTLTNYATEGSRSMAVELFNFSPIWFRALRRAFKSHVFLCPLARNNGIDREEDHGQHCRTSRLVLIHFQSFPRFFPLIDKHNRQFSPNKRH